MTMILSTKTLRQASRVREIAKATEVCHASVSVCLVRHSEIFRKSRRSKPLSKHAACPHVARLVSYTADVELTLLSSCLKV